jgi:Flp pilus assembly protein TadG
MANLFRRFLANHKGNTAITFAIAIVPVLLATGAAVDYLRYAAAKSELQAALDSGALAVAAAQTLTASGRIAAGNSSFNRNMEASGLGGEDIEADFAISGTAISATATLKLPTALMQIAGITTMDVTAETEISIPDVKKAEIAMVLDYSGSMDDRVAGQKKYISMKIAAKKLVSDLAAANPTNIKIGLVPFSHHVYVTLPNDYVSGAGTGGSWTGCTQDRPYPLNRSATTPTTSNATKWGQPQAPDHLAWGCADYAPKSLRVKPLTADFAGINTQLDAMRPYAWTHIALGAEFGYHLLSPNQPFAEGVDFTDTKTRKFMVILTDGMQTEPGFGPGGARNVAMAEKNLEAICGNAKADGITIMTIAYDLDDTDTRKRLKACASDPDKDFFVADDGTAVSQAFQQIKEQIVARVYISK